MLLTAFGFDEDGDEIAYAWDLDDDGAFGDATGTAASTSFGTAGSHSVAVRATDALGMVASASRTVTVAAPVPPATGAAATTTITTPPGSGSTAVVAHLRIASLVVRGRRLQVRLTRPAGTRLQCSLVRRAAKGKTPTRWTLCYERSTYSGLARGVYVFRARAGTQTTKARIVRIR